MTIQQTPAEEALGFMLPTRRVESFHYTDLRSLLQEIPEGVAAMADNDGEDIRLVKSVRLPFHDGKLVLDQADDLPKGIKLTSDVEKPTAEGMDHVIVAMNAAGEGDAIGIEIEGDLGSELPLDLFHSSSSEGRTSCYHKVNVKAGSEALVLDRYESADSLSALSTSVTDLHLEEGAKLVWIIVQKESTQATRLARMNISLEKDADLQVVVINAGGKLVRQEIHVGVKGENANLGLSGVNLVGDGAHIDVTTVLEHSVPHTTAEELFRNVVTGDGKGVFQGQIKVAQAAQKTDAQMACNTLLLTDESDFSAKPELEIFADDVICAHGATVTDIDDEHLFYLRARGIDERTARTMLIKAFVDEVVEELEVDFALKEGLTDIIDTWLDAHI